MKICLKDLKKTFPIMKSILSLTNSGLVKRMEELLKLMLENDFAVLLTFDKNLQHQQNFEKFPITVFVLTASNNIYDLLKPLAILINSKLSSLPLKAGIEIISS